MYFPSKILRYLYHKVFFKQIIDNVFNDNNNYDVVIFYKTSPFLYGNVNEHTNNNEIVLMSRILSKYGFNVHILDRTLELNDNTLKKLKKYNNIDLFIGKGSGGTGDLYVELTNLLKPKLRVLYTTSENYEQRNLKNHDRYEYFFKRHNKKIERKRNVVCSNRLKDIVNNADALFSIGNDYNLFGYKKFKKEIYKIFPSTDSRLRYINRSYSTPYSFLYFGGNGCVHKGLDLLLDVFKDLDINLHICAPNNEKDFFNFYRDLLVNSENIFYHGFVEVGSKKFYDVVKKNTFVVLPSCSEASATSIATCIRTGLIPVITRDVGYDVEDYGFLLEQYDVDYIKNYINELFLKDKDEIKMKSLGAFKASFSYTEKSFEESFEKAVVDLIY